MPTVPQRRSITVERKAHKQWRVSGCNVRTRDRQDRKAPGEVGRKEKQPPRRVRSPTRRVGAQRRSQEFGPAFLFDRLTSLMKAVDTAVACAKLLPKLLS
uniref:Uncharacterized protein n=1 Tax=Trichuris muris TaxID=70415 RepID=A0A5S6R2M9_TRIMR